MPSVENEGDNYKSDAEDCRTQVKNRDTSKQTAFGMFSLIGYAVASATVEKSDDMWKSDKELFNDCMTKKGYSVIK